jgi:peptidoglycan/xylan/chitin deacetylase (PgdA/CDA1 family)
MPAESTTVCLSFDFDAISVWLGSFGLRTPTTMSRGEFGANVATPRILDLLEREEVPASWYVPGLDAEAFPDVCRRIRDAGHEIGHHGYCHESPAGLDEAAERDVLERGLAALDGVLGVRPTGYRSPGFDLSPNSTRLLHEYGFRYDSSLMGRDFEPYRCRTGDVFHTDRAPDWGREIDLVEVPISWTLDDFPFVEYVSAPHVRLPASTDVAALGQRWLDDLDFLVEELPGGVYTLTLHPQSIGRASRLRLLAAVIRRGKEHGVRFSTLADAAAAWSGR